MRKKIGLRLLCIFATLAFVFNVYAGSVTVGFSSKDSVTVNQNIDVIVTVADVDGLTDGVATVQGDISFDESYLEYVKHEDVSSSLSVSYGAKTKRFVALGMGGEYVAHADRLLKLTFKAKRAGTTTIKVGNVIVGDTKAIMHSSNVQEKTIRIVDASHPSTPIPINPSNDIKAPVNKAPSKKSSDASLSKLVVNNAKMTPAFHSNVTEYQVEVSKDVEKLQLDYVTSNKNAKVSVVGNEKLKDGEATIVKVVVTAEDGSKKTYTLTVTKADEEVENKLERLDVEESTLKFDEDVFEYTLKVNGKVDKLTINAIPKKKDTKVEIIGNDKLETGNNAILIKLTDKNGYVNYYKINVKKTDGFTFLGMSLGKILFYLFFLFLLLLLIFLIFLLVKREKEEESEEMIQVRKDALEEIRNFEPQHNKEENVDIYDDIVTKDELIDAIEERNPKKLKMLLKQEEANRLKEELKKEEEDKNI